MRNDTFIEQLYSPSIPSTEIILDLDRVDSLCCNLFMYLENSRMNCWHLSFVFTQYPDTRKLAQVT